jgi:gamma-glutamyltranspeptidase
MSAVLPSSSLPQSRRDAYILAYEGEGRVTDLLRRQGAGAARSSAGGAMPRHGGAAVAIPGLIDGWQAVVGRWCVPMRDLLQPAICYARDGFAVSRELYRAARIGGLFRHYRARRRAVPRRQSAAFGSCANRSSQASSGGRGRRTRTFRGPMAERIAEGVQAAGGADR